MIRTDEGYDSEGNLVAWRYTTEDFLGPTVAVESTPKAEFLLKLELSKHEHDVLINVLKRESYNPTVKAIYQAVKEANDVARNTTLPDG